MKSAKKGDKVQLFPNIYKRDLLYKTNDIKLNEEIRKTYEDKYIRKISIDINVDFSVGKLYP